MRKSERLQLALELFEGMPPAQDAAAAMKQLGEALRSVEVEHSGFADYSIQRGYANAQLHLFPYYAESPFWRHHPDAGHTLVCQLTSHYAVFGSEGGVAIFTRDNCVGRDLVFCKPRGMLPVGTRDVRLWPE